jgi:hypothetical protein
MRENKSRAHAERGNQERTVIPYPGASRNEEPVMARTVRLLLVLALLGGTRMASPALAQTADAPSAADAETASPATTTEPAFLKTFPRPPDQPASLLAPAPPVGPPPPNLEQPYYFQDALVNPPELGAVGWFADVDVGILKPHLLNHVGLPVTFPDGSSTQVGVNAVPLNWTAAPRVEVGYRFAAGLGGVALSYRNMTSEGSQALIGADGPATLTDQLNASIIDLDWVSNEYTQLRGWEMRVRFGLRYLNAYFAAQANEPFAEAAVGTTFYQMAVSNSTWALGPHVGVDVRRRLNFWGLAVTGFFDASDGWSRVRQTFFAASTTSASGAPQTGQFSAATSSSAPVMTLRLGLTWEPAAHPTIHLFAGGQWDYWWDIGRNGSFLVNGSPPYGYFFDSGFVLRGEWNF